MVINSRLKIQGVDIFFEKYLLLKFRQPLIKIKYRPGQFFVLKLPISEKKTINRSYSVISKNESKTIDFLIELKRSGEASTFLKENYQTLRQIQISGPYGDFLSNINPNINSFFWASGIGITPFIPFINSSNEKLKIFWSVKNSLLREVLDSIGTQTDRISIYDKSLSNRLKIQKIRLERFLAHHYLCGSENYMKELTNKLIDLEHRNIFRESFFEDFQLPKAYKGKISTITFHETFEHSNKNTILESLISKVNLHEDYYSCMSGHCGKCKLSIKDGMVLEFDKDNNLKEKTFGESFLACRAFTKSDKLNLTK